MLREIIAHLVRLICGARGATRGYAPSRAQSIFFANHSSHLDFLLIWAALPPEIREMTRPVAGSDYWLKGPIRSLVSKDIFRSVLIDRLASKPELVVEQMVEALQDGNSLILFPEGTRSLDGEIHQFKSGLYYLASKRRDVQLVPVYLENLNRILPKGEFLIVPILGSVTFGAPIHLAEDESKKEFLERARNSLLALEG